MANSNQQFSTADHDYKLASCGAATAERALEEMEDVMMPRNIRTPLPSPNPKRIKKEDYKGQHSDIVSNQSIFKVVQLILKKFNEQDKWLKSFEECIEMAQENKRDIATLQEQVDLLSKENKSLKDMCLESARYKRRRDLWLLGLPEQDEENTREAVIGILTHIILVSADKPQDTVDTVHCLGRSQQQHAEAHHCAVSYTDTTSLEEVTTEVNCVWRITWEQKTSLNPPLRGHASLYCRSVVLMGK